jgi:hypothetical protein
MLHKGGCHCGAVRFEFEGPAHLDVTECNCSICSKTAYLHYFVKQHTFKILQGADQLTEYTFDTGEAKHLFCKHCGIKSFYIPRSHPDSYSVNVRCLDEGSVESMTVTPFDGRNWEASIEALRSRDR